MEPAFFLVTGDLSERGELESYSRLMDLVAEVEDEGYPVLLAMGNHDVRDNFYRVFKGRHCDDEERYCYTSNVGGLRAVLLDSLVQGRAPQRRRTDRLQLERLDRILECRAPAMASALDHIDEASGGTREYVRAAAIDDDTLDRLHSLLVESG